MAMEPHHDDPKWWFRMVSSSDVDALREAAERVPFGLNVREPDGRTLLHTAAECDAAEVIDLFTAYKLDLNAEDELKNTPLHVAIQFNNANAIRALIQAGASVTSCNNAGLNALFYSVEVDHLASIEALISHSNVDINATDDRGYNALHYAAEKNHTACAVFLLEHGADYQKENLADETPLGTAAHNGSSATLRAILEYLQLCNGKVLELVNAFRSNGFFLLLEAIDHGRLESVQVCLDFGAQIDQRQKYQVKATPVHYAARRGQLDILRAMFAAQPERKLNTVRMKDKNGATALHKAALFDHAAVAELLLDEGAEIDAVDFLNQTPLLVAAHKNRKQCIRLLIKRGADVSHVDDSGRNFFHLAVLSGVHLDSLTLGDDFLSNVKVSEVFNRRDKVGCTPLHCATIKGHQSSLHFLLVGGALPSVQNFKKATPLHLAAKYGRFNTCKTLLDSSEAARIVDMTDAHGWTALHFASRYGHTKVAQLVLERGAIFHRAYCGSTEFSLAAQGGHMAVMDLLLSYNRHFINLPCYSGTTALHQAGLHDHAKAVEFLLTQGAAITLDRQGCTFFDLAMKNRRKLACVAAMKHERWKEVLSTLSPAYPSPIFGLIEELPEVCAQVLEQCVTTNNKVSRDPDLATTYDFTFLELVRPSTSNTYSYASDNYDNYNCNSVEVNGNNSLSASESEETENARSDGPNRNFKQDQFKAIRSSSLPVLNHMVKLGRSDLLVSPTCAAYLDMKWFRLSRRLAMVHILPHVILLLLLNYFCWKAPEAMQCYLLVNQHCNQWTNTTCADQYLQSAVCTMSMDLKITIVFMLCFALAHILPLLIFYKLMKLKIFQDLTITFLTLIVISLLSFTIPSILTPGMMIISSYQWSFLAFAALIEYSLVALFIRVHSIVGLYVDTYLEILKSLLVVSVVFGFFLFAFSLAFNILFKVPVESPTDYETYRPALSYDDLLVSLMRVLVMLTGELKYDETIARPLANPKLSKGLPFSATTVLMFCVSILLLSIALYNLIIGLAIGDTKVIQQQAALKRIDSLAYYFTLIENLIQKNCWLRLFSTESRPLSFTVYPNRPASFLERFFRSSSYGKIHSKAKELAQTKKNAESARVSINKWMKKHKNSLQNLQLILDRQAEAHRLLMDKLKIHPDSTSLADDGKFNAVDAELKSATSVSFKSLRKLQNL